jgi:poly(3-hydroxyalkanoate) synthetase
VDDAELDDQTHKRLRLLVGNLVDALSPSNNVFLNPQATKVTIDTRGANLVRGARRSGQVRVSRAGAAVNGLVQAPAAAPAAGQPRPEQDAG